MPTEQHPIPQGERLHHLRGQDMTASDLGALAGVDPYKTPLQLYAEKTGQLPGPPDNVMMRRGRWLEPAVIEAIREEHPDWEVRRLKTYFRDPALRIGATPDSIIQTDEPGLTNCQLKVVAAPEFARHWSDDPPMRYILQTLCEGMLMDVERSLLAALVISTYSADLHLFAVSRHASAERRIRTLVEQFWDNVASGRRPAADYGRDAATLAAIYPQSVPEPVLDLTGDNLLPERLNERLMLKTGIGVMEERVSEIDTEIRDKLGEAERADLPGWKLSLKTQHRKEHVVPATSYRVLRVTRLAEEEEAAA